MNRYIAVSILLLATLSVGCRDAERILQSEETEISQNIDKKENTLEPKSEKIRYIDRTDATFPDVIRVCFDEKSAEQIERALSSRGLRSLGGDVSALIERLDAVELSRVFPHAGKYEKRTRKEGLHLWYDIMLRPEADPKRAREAQEEAMKLAATLSEVTFVEQVYRTKLPNQEPTLFSAENVASQLRSVEDDLPTDDPQLNMQWHYHNDGRFVRSKKNADINLFEAWKQEMGKSEVIVAVIDGGIDHQHEDLRENMHINTIELNGKTGYDDDENGLIDDVYGYNFANDDAVIIPHVHGTHVAGTIAARNNNGIGVSGVAGGNGTPGSGVRLISCQVFLPEGFPRSKVRDYFEQALKAAADMGAVISQNSWGAAGQNTYIPEARKKAIDYFIKYAGCDEEGNQRPDSPMKGGVVIFAAGNDGADFKASPASYAPVISVSSMSFDFTVAPYSNRGDWVSIMAPGGSVYDHYGQVLSTLPDNKYGYFQGTSMACPHVSGVAALIISKFGGPGFTCADLKRRLIRSILPVDINAMNPRYAGRLGAGYIDAAAALADHDNKNIAPEEVKIGGVEVKQTMATLSWIISEDPDDAIALGYNVYVSTMPISLDNMTGETVKRFIRSDPNKKKGDEMSITISGMKHATKYYFAIEAYDRWGNKSTLTFGELITSGNQAPVISLPEDFKAPKLTGKETAIVKLKVNDAEGNAWSAKIEGTSYGAKLIRQGEFLELHLRVVSVPDKYQVRVLVTDELEGSAHIDIPFEIYNNKAPKATKRIERIEVEAGMNSKDVNLSTLFIDPEGDELAYSIRTVGKPTANCRIEGKTLRIHPQSIGVSGFMLTATDTNGNKAIMALEINVK